VVAPCPSFDLKSERDMQKLSHNKRHSAFDTKMQPSPVIARPVVSRKLCRPVNVLAPFPGAEDAAGTTRDLKKLRLITGAFTEFVAIDSR